MNSKWGATNFNAARCGTMICCTCNRKVEYGDFRVRQKAVSKWDWGYQVQHRACSADWRGWIDFDAKRTSQLESMTLKLAAYEQFSEQWSESALHEEIQTLERFIGELREELSCAASSA